MGVLAREGRKCENRVVVIYTQVNQSDIPRSQAELPDPHRYHVYITFLDAFDVVLSPIIFNAEIHIARCRITYGAVKRKQEERNGQMLTHQSIS